MSPNQQKVYERIITSVAEKHNLPVSVVDKTYRVFWKFVRASLSELPLKEALTEEEYNQLRVSINVPSLGKFFCDFERYSRVKKRFEYIKKIKEYDNQKN